MADKKYPKSFDVYRKGKAAAQFKLAADIDRPGVFLELSDTPKGDGFLWDDKVTVKLGIPDLTKIANGFNTGAEEIKIYHDPGAGTDDKGKISKNIAFKRSATGYYMNVSVVKDRVPMKRINVAMSSDEVFALTVLFETAITKILRWS